MSKRSYQKSIDGQSIIIPKELIEAQPIEVSAKTFKQMVKPPTDLPKEKKPMSEAKRAALDKLIAANKERRRLRLEDRAKLAEVPELVEKVVEEETKFREEVLKPTKKAMLVERKASDENAKLAAGTHVKILVKKQTRRKRMVLPPSETETSDLTTDMSESDTDLEEYKSKSRQVRKAQVAKKLVRTVEKIDRVIQQAAPVPSNPYTNMLANRWR